MKVILEPKESEEIFYNSLCNGHGLAHCGLSIDMSDSDYNRAKKRLVKRGESICLEDVWMEVLRGGGKLTLVDEDGCEDPVSVTMPLVHERVQTAPIEHLMDAVNGHDDGTTAEAILQQVFYQDVIFG
jgi:hypothetical protein